MILFIVLILPGLAWTDTSKFLSFKSSERPRSLIVVSTSQTVNVSAGWSTVTRIEVHGGLIDVKIRYKCYVNPLKKEDEISELEFRQYVRFRRHHTSRERNDYVYGGWIFNASETPYFEWDSWHEGFANLSSMSYHPKRGGEVVYYMAQKQKTVEIVMKCTAKNRNGLLESSDLTILDYRYQFRKAFDDWKNMKRDPLKIDPRFPSVINCFRQPLKPRPWAMVQYDWFYCGESVCKSLREISTPKWRVMIFPRNGSLAWNYIPQDVQNVLQGKWLKCVIGKVSIVWHSVKIVFQKPQIAHPKDYKQLYPKEKLKKLVIRAEDPGMFYLPYLFFGDNDNDTVLEYFELKKKKRINLRDYQPSNGRCYMSKFSGLPICKGPFTKNLKILLKLRLHGKQHELRYKIRVKHAGQAMSEDVPRVVFGVDGSREIYLRCKCKDKKMEPGFQFLGRKADTSGDITDLRDLKHVQDLYFGTRMAKVKANLSLITEYDGRSRYSCFFVPACTLVYVVKDLRYLNQKNTLSQNHYVNCVCIGDFGPLVLKQVFITVLPRPKGVKLESRSIEHGKIISVNFTDKDEILDLGATITYHWEINGTSTENFTRKWLKTRKINNGSELEIKIIKTNCSKPIAIVVSIAIQLENPTVSEKSEYRFIFKTSPMNATLVFLCSYKTQRNDSDGNKNKHRNAKKISIPQHVNAQLQVTSSATYFSLFSGRLTIISVLFPIMYRSI